MKKTVTQEDVVENVKTITDLIETHISEPNKTVLLDALNGDFGELFFTAPASGNSKFHLPIPGGLAAHSLNVVFALKKLNDTFDLKLTEEDMVICALLHDFSKACTPDMETPHYVPTEKEEKWRAEKYGDVYTKDYSKGYLTNRDRTNFLLQKLGVKLSFDQFQAIMMADGWFGEQNKSYVQGYCSRLSLFLHFADFISAIQEKE